MDSKDKTAFPLSYGQKALWLLYKLAPDQAAYNVNFAWRIHGKLDIDILKQALQKLIKRHSSLRTTYSINDKGEPIQNIHHDMPLHFDETNASSWDEERVQEVLTSKAYCPFDLEKGPVQRWSLLNVSKTDNILMMSVHHIAIDMWSLMILANELSQLYEQYISSDETKKNTLSNNKLAYTDIIQWQIKMLNGPRGEKHWKFWQSHLSGDLPPLNLPIDKPRPPVINYGNDTYSFSIPSELAAKLKHMAKEESVTLFALYLAAYYTLLYRYTGQSDILVHTPTAGRSLKYKGVVGYFVNPNVLRANPSGTLTFKKFLQQLHQTTSATLLHRDYPFPLLVEKLHPKRHSTHTPLTQVSFAWNDPNIYVNQRSPIVEIDKDGKEVWKIGGLDWERLDVIPLLHDFDMALTLNSIKDDISFNLEYNTELFEKDTVKRIAGHYHMLLNGIAKDYDQLLIDLPLLTEVEKKQLLVDWNNTQATYPEEMCIQQWFENQVQKQPNQVAIIFGKEELTYKELNIQANQLAHHLQALGVGPEMLVGICMERSFDIVISLLGILKAGGAYVPIDSKYPQERINFILEDAKPEIILTQQSLKELLPTDTPSVPIDITRKNIPRHHSENPSISVNLSNLAYLIYTSGSTGQPKGVAVEHRGVSVLINWSAQTFSSKELSGVLAAASLNFDLSVFEILVPLSLGGTVILAENALHLPTLPKANRVRMIAIAPAAVKELLRIKGIPQSVRTVGLGGETLTNPIVQQLYQLGHIERVVNQYGLTEDTVISTFAEIEQQDDHVPPIGKPLPKTQTYVLNSNLEPVPIGVHGELFIGGAGLAREYYNRPRLTKEKFIANPFNTKLSQYLYRTGDLVKYLPNGNLHFLGRIDHQVKIRGFRIELEEIQSIVDRHPSVQESIVIAQEGTENKELVSYVVFKTGKEEDSQAIKKFISKYLPDYMVPSVIFPLNTIPLNPSGKIDHKALPKVSHQKQEKATERSLPQSLVEKTIAEVWKSILNIEQVGIHENFFDIGGHSLLFAQVYARLPEVLRKHLSVVDLFQYPTIYKLTEFLDSKQDPSAIFQKKNSTEEKVKQAPGRLKNTPVPKIAIVGMAGQFPGAKDIDQYWENIVHKVVSISQFTDEEMENERIDPALWKSPNYVKASGVLKGIDLF